MKHHTHPQDHDTRYAIWASKCQGKQPFESRALAEKLARRRGNSAYKCKGCGKWHVGRGPR